MFIIDIHNHIDIGPELILQAMEEAGITYSVVFCIGCTAYKGNLITCNGIKKYPDKFIGFANGFPSFKDDVTKETERAIRDYNFKGIKIHRTFHTLATYLMAPLIEKAIELDVPCLIDPLGNYEEIEEISNRWPKAKLIIAHLGNGNFEKFIELAKEREGVYLDTSFIRNPAGIDWIEKAVRIAGAEKILFGTDGVIHPLPEIYKIKVLKLSKEEENKIFYQNAAKLLKLDS